MTKNTNKIAIFTSEELGQIRIMETDGEPWFVGKDVTKALGYSNARDAISKHVHEDDKGVAKCDTLGGETRFNSYQRIRIIRPYLQQQA